MLYRHAASTGCITLAYNFLEELCTLFDLIHEMALALVVFIG